MVCREHACAEAGGCAYRKRFDLILEFEELCALDIASRRKPLDEIHDKDPAREDSVPLAPFPRLSLHKSWTVDRLAQLVEHQRLDRAPHFLIVHVAHLYQNKRAFAGDPIVGFFPFNNIWTRSIIDMNCEAFVTIRSIGHIDHPMPGPRTVLPVKKDI
jgi:hypothetical protein